MGYYLTESEAKISRTITNIAKELPGYVDEFALYMEFELNKSFGYIYECVRNIRLFYQVISSERNIRVDDFDVSIISAISLKEVEKYLSCSSKSKGKCSKTYVPSFSMRNKRKHSLWFYYEFLVLNNYIDNNLELDLFYKVENKNIKIKLKKISTPEDVKFTGDAKKKTTIDGKYSLIKEKNPNSEESKFLYYIRNEESGKFITDERGNIISRISYMEARKFVKNLYK